MSDREILTTRLTEAGLIEKRLVPVDDGTKACTIPHTDASNRESSFDSLSGNYGVYAGANPSGDCWLVDIDIDDYTEDAGGDALEVVNNLPDTFTVESPHTDGVTGGHRYYYINGKDTHKSIERVAGAFNPGMSWGEIRVHNQYVVGPGSQLNGCNKEWCDDCSKPDGGFYQIATDAPIAELTLPQLFEVIEADESDENTSQAGGSVDTSGDTPDLDGDVSHAKAVAKHYSSIETYLLHGSDDRSESDFHVCRRLIEHGVDEAEAYRLLASNSNSKVDADDAFRDYWHRTWQRAGQKVSNDANTKNLPSDTRPDGGSQAMTPTPEAGETGFADEYSLSPTGVINAALDDPYGRLSVSDSGDKPTIHGLRNAEAATYVWDVMEQGGRDDVLAVSNGQLRAYDDGVWIPQGEQQLREYGRQGLQSAYSSRVLKQLKEETRARKIVAPDELGAPDKTIAVKNGLLHLLERDDPQLEALKREHRAIRRLNVAYDSDADPPKRWLQFLDESIRDDTDLRKLQEYAGYTLWHHSQPFGKALFLVGPTDSGKGTALKLIQSVLGEENVGNESLYDLMQTRWGAAGIYGTAANIRNEVTAGGLKNVERFKELTGGGDTITAEYKGQDTFDFTVTQKFLFATNEVPSIKGADEAFYNRCLFVRFPDTVPQSEQDKALLDKLRGEKSGILNWMLEGLHRLMNQGQFSGERDVGGKKELCDAFGGVVDRFIHNCVEVTGESNHIAHKGDIHDLAQAYADDIDKDPEWNAQSGFTRAMKETSGINDGQSQKLTGSNTKVFTGIKPLSAAVDELDTNIRWTNTTETKQESLDT